MMLCFYIQLHVIYFTVYNLLKTAPFVCISKIHYWFHTALEVTHIDTVYCII